MKLSKRPPHEEPDLLITKKRKSIVLVETADGFVPQRSMGSLEDASVGEVDELCQTGSARWAQSGFNRDLSQKPKTRLEKHIARGLRSGFYKQDCSQHVHHVTAPGPLVTQHNDTKQDTSTIARLEGVVDVAFHVEDSRVLSEQEAASGSVKHWEQRLPLAYVLAQWPGNTRLVGTDEMHQTIRKPSATGRNEHEQFYTFCSLRSGGPFLQCADQIDQASDWALGPSAKCVSRERVPPTAAGVHHLHRPARLFRCRSVLQQNAPSPFAVGA